MDRLGANEHKPGRRRVISMRLIVTTTAVALIASAVIGVGSVAERNTRHALTKQLETQLMLDARGLAGASSGALLSDYPELTLHPLVKEMVADRLDLLFVFVVDRGNVVQGHADIGRLGKPFKLAGTLESVEPHVELHRSERLVGDSSILALDSPVRHPNGQIIGSVIVGVDRGHIQTALAQARKQQLIFLLPILAAAIAVTLLLMSRLLQPISALRRGLDRIGHGDLEARLDVSSRTELGLLAQSVNDMATALKTAQMDLVEKERLDHEMELAREIQHSLLPAEDLSHGHVTITGSQTSAAEVGGDYYDFFTLDQTRAGILIADVAGKGLSGCLVMSMIAALVRYLCRIHTSPRDLLIALEESLINSLQSGTFVTMFYGILDTETGRLTYASAGHNPVVHYRLVDQESAWHETKGVPIGLVKGALTQSLEDSTLDLAPGDVLMQFTDGFNEAIDANGQEYGFDRMVELFEGRAQDGCQAVMRELCESVDKWETGARTDDRTLLLVQRSRSAEVIAPQPRIDAARFLATPKPDRVLALWKRRDRSHLFFSVPATLDALDDIHRKLKQHRSIKELTDDEFSLLEQGLYEVCANIAEHGCGLDPDKTIDVWWLPGDRDDPSSRSSDSVSDGCFLIRDDGKPPDFTKWTIPDLNSETVTQDGRGLGLRMIDAIMQNVEVHASTAVGNITIMKFKKQPAEVS